MTVSPQECPSCKLTRKIHAQGLCAGCYNRTCREKRNGYRWPSELVATLREMAQKGDLRMRQIGERLGVSKNAVCGKLDRLRDEEYDGPTAMDRLQALHDRMDAVLAECGRVRMYRPKKELLAHWGLVSQFPSSRVRPTPAPNR
jgi:hypothetical protein